VVIRQPVIPLDLEDISLAPFDLAEGFFGDALRIESGDLTGLVSQDVHLARCLMSGVQATGCSLERPRFTDVVLEKCNFSNAELPNLEAVRVEFKGCFLTGLISGDSDFEDVLFEECRLGYAQLRFCRFSKVILRNCDLTGADFSGTTMESVEFRGCEMKEATFERCKLSNVDLRSSAIVGLRSADGLSGATLDSVQLVEVAPLLAIAQGLVVNDS
jgi:uncharacterized protein YjbI with pentapeptide repeats